MRLSQEKYFVDWMNYFEMMKDWKKLPAYRAEPRIDSLVGYYLPRKGSRR